MNLQQALAELGVREDLLTPEERQHLDERGFLNLGRVLSDEHLDALRSRCRELLDEEGEEAGLEVHQEPGTARLANLVSKGRVFDTLYTTPRVLAGIGHVLQWDFRLSSLNSRDALPGSGNQALHPDWHQPVPDGNYQVCNSIWLLDDMTPGNGATRIVPGSHNSDVLPADAMEDPKNPHPDQVRVEGKAGDVLLMNSHVWHGGTHNKTDQPRRALFAYYCRRHQKPQTDFENLVGNETRARLSEAQRVILGLAG